MEAYARKVVKVVVYISCGKKVVNIANHAVSPSFIESYGLPIAISTLVIGTGAALKIKRQNNKHKITETKENTK